MQTPDPMKQMFLDMQEHPEHYSDQQLEAMMDELDRVADTETAWRRFASAHPRRQTATRISRYRKMAASFVGVVMMSGIAFAAIHIVRQNQKPATPPAADAIAVARAQRSALGTRGEEADTLVMPRVFENVPLDSMLTEIAGYYRIAVDFQREDVRQLRFHFVWKPEDNLDRVVERLNHFEAVNIEREPEKLTVR